MASRVLPFPFPLRIGTDICQISRIHRILSGAQGPRFVRRVLTEEERAWPGRDDHPLSIILSGAAPGDAREREGGRKPALPTEAERQSQLWKAATFMAGRFAAKEAAIKAHPHRRLTFHEVVVRRATTTTTTTTTTTAAASTASSSSAEQQHETPLLQRSGSGPPVAIIRAADDDADDADREAALSISHDGDYATAVCLAFDPTVADGAGGVGGALR